MRVIAFLWLLVACASSARADVAGVFVTENGIAVPGGEVVLRGQDNQLVRAPVDVDGRFRVSVAAFTPGDEFLAVAQGIHEDRPVVGLLQFNRKMAFVHGPNHSLVVVAQPAHEVAIHVDQRALGGAVPKHVALEIWLNERVPVPVAHVVTDTTGTALVLLPEGAYIAVVVDARFAQTDRGFDLPEDRSVHVRLAQSRSLSIHVKDESTGAPVPNEVVRVADEKEWDLFLEPLQTDKHGKVTVNRIPKNQDVLVRAKGRGRRSARAWTLSKPTDTSVTVLAPKYKLRVFSYPVSATNAPPPNAQLKIRSVSTNWQEQSTRFVDGRVSVHWTWALYGWYAVLNETSAASLTPLRATPRVEFRPIRRFGFRVVDADGVPLRGASIKFSGAMLLLTNGKLQGHGLRATLDNEGRCQGQGVWWGDVKVSLVGPIVPSHAEVVGALVPTTAPAELPTLRLGRVRELHFDVTFDGAEGPRTQVRIGYGSTFVFDRDFSGSVRIIRTRVVQGPDRQVWLQAEGYKPVNRTIAFAPSGPTTVRVDFKIDPDAE